MSEPERDAREVLAWMVKHRNYVELWTARRKDSALAQVKSLRSAYPADQVSLTPLAALDAAQPEPSEVEREGLERLERREERLEEALREIAYICEDRPEDEDLEAISTIVSRARAALGGE